MSATITAEATAADLLAELRELVNRYDGAATLDDVRQLADEVTARLRRARGRISRIVKAAAPPAPVVEPKPAAEPAAAAKESLKAAEPNTQISQITQARNLTPPPPERPVNQSDSPETHTLTRPHRATFHVALAVLTVVSSLWSTTSTRTRRTVRAIRSTGRRAGRLAAAVRTALARLGGAS